MYSIFTRLYQKNSYTLNIGVVIQYLPNMIINGQISFSLEVVTLLMLVCGQRNHEFLPLVSVDNIKLSGICIIQIGDLMKTSSPLFLNGKFRFSTHPQVETIYPFFHIHKYIKQTESQMVISWLYKT